MDDPTFWRSLRLLREHGLDAGDELALSYVLTRAEELWKRLHELEPKAAAYDAMEAAYAAAGTASTKERQAAACRAGGLTRTDGSGPRDDPHYVLHRWYRLVLATRDRRVALEALGEEEGKSPEAMARHLRRFRQRMSELLEEGHPDATELRWHLDCLSEGPYAVPDGRETRTD